jgi:hypothetical protein
MLAAVMRVGSQSETWTRPWKSRGCQLNLWVFVCVGWWVWVSEKKRREEKKVSELI